MLRLRCSAGWASSAGPCGPRSRGWPTVQAHRSAKRCSGSSCWAGCSSTDHRHRQAPETPADFAAPGSVDCRFGYYPNTANRLTQGRALLTRVPGILGGGCWSPPAPADVAPVAMWCRAGRCGGSCCTEVPLGLNVRNEAAIAARPDGFIFCEPPAGCLMRGRPARTTPTWRARFRRRDSWSV